jgi:hypothetical protein
VKSVWLVNLKNGEWYFDSEHPLDLENPRSHFGCAAKDGSIYIFGGNDAEAKYLHKTIQVRYWIFDGDYDVLFIFLGLYLHVKNLTLFSTLGHQLCQWMDQG